jgi:hypothetical protein
LEKYQLSNRDWLILSVTNKLLEKIIRSPIVVSAQLASIFRLRESLRRLPYVTNKIYAHISLASEYFAIDGIEIMRFWEITNENGFLIIKSGGACITSAGADSFTTMRLTVKPGSDSNFINGLLYCGIVPSLKRFDLEISELKIDKTYEITIYDGSNKLLRDFSQYVVADELVAPPIISDEEYGYSIYLNP